MVEDKFRTNRDLPLRHGVSLSPLNTEYDATSAATSGSEDGGEIERLRHERDCLAKAIGDAAQKAGITASGAALTGPMLLMLCDDLADCALAKPASEPAGGGVREALQKLYDGGVACHDLWFFKELKQIIAALSSSAGPAVEADMRRVCEALGFDPGNHHNALKCPYCNPKGLQFAYPAPATVEMREVTTAMVNAAWNEGKTRRMTGRPNDFRAVLEAALAPATEGRKS